MKFYATLPPGLEDVASEEIKRLGGSIEEIRKLRGRVFFKGKKKLISELNYKARCIERVILLLVRGFFENLDEIYYAIKKLDFKFLEGKSFAIRSMRTGEHDFTSIDVARVAGQAVIDSFMENYKKRLRVNLNEPDVIIRVDVVENEFFVGIDTTGDDALHKRWWRVYNHPAHLNSTIACAMIYLSEWKKNENLIDPMCGSGTIPIEAALIGRNIAPGKNRMFAYSKICNCDVPKVKEGKDIMDIRGIEKFRKHLDGAIKNAESAGVLDTISFKLGDATKMDGNYDVIITNPPYGLRIASKKVIEKLYNGFVRSAKECMNDKSRLVVITAEEKILREAIANKRLSIVHERFVRYGGLNTKILVVTKD